MSLLLAATAYGISTTLSVVALHAVRPVDLLAVELAGAAAVQLGAAAVTGLLHRRGALRQLLLGVLFPGLAFLLADLGLARTSASNGSLLLAADPLLSVLLAVVVLGERLRGRAVVALAIGLGGSALVALDPGTAEAHTGTVSGNLLVLAAVLAGAVFLVATRRYNDDDGLSASAWQTTGGALSTAPFVAVAWISGGSRLATAGATAWTACVAVLLCGVAAGVAFNHGISRVTASRASQLLTLTPVVGLLTAVVLLGEQPTPIRLAGGAAILLGLTLLLRSAPGPGHPQPAADEAVKTVVEPPAVAGSAAGPPINRTVRHR